MKRILFLLLVFLSMTHIRAQESRLVLVEEFANASSTSCQAQHSVSGEIIAANAGKVIYISYHTNWPGPDPMSGNSQNREQFYQADRLPLMLINGKPTKGPHYTGATANLNQAFLNEESNLPSPVSFELSHRRIANGDSIAISLTIKALRNFSGPHAIFLALATNQAEVQNASIHKSDNCFRNVFSEMIPDQRGISLPEKVQAGESYVFNYTVSLASLKDPWQACLIGWIQNIDTKAVLQAAYSKPVGPDHVDAAIVAVNEPGKKRCGNDMNPEIVIQNIGGKVLTSLEINWSVNNEAVRNFVWSGSLDFLSKETIVLPITGFTPAPQHNALKISIRNPNGINDANTANDSLVTYFDAAGNTGLPLKLELRTDQFPSEVSWKIVNSSGIVSLSGDHYNAPNSIFTQNIDLPADECYTFIIDDRGGDGICCKYGNGSYKLLNSQGVEIATGGNFGNTESVPFKVSAKEGLSELEMVTDFQVFPNPFDNNATISIFISREMNVKVRVSNEMGQIVFSQDSEALPAGSHTYELNGENWAPGIYVVKVVTDGKLLTRKLTLTK